MTKKCKKCLSSSSGINPFNLEGICQECADVEVLPITSRERDLSSLLNATSGKRFDLLVALSGGKDSAYLLHYLSRVQGRRLYALTWNHGHNRDVVWKNIDKALQNAGNVDWEAFSYRHDYMTMVRQALLMEVKNMCMCAHFVNLRAIQTCMTEEIPFIAFGFAPAQTAKRGRFEVLESKKRYSAFQEYAASFRRLIYHCLNQHYPEKAEEVASYLFQPLEDEIKRATFFPAFLEVSCYVPWEAAAIRKVVAEIGWKRDINQEGDLHTNCIFEPMRGHIEYLTGKSLLISELNYTIRAGEISRDEALRELQASGYGNIPPKGSDKFFDFIELPRRRFYEELSKPISSEAKSLLADFVRAGYVVRGYEDAAKKIIQ